VFDDRKWGGNTELQEMALRLGLVVIFGCVSADGLGRGNSK